MSRLQALLRIHGMKIGFSSESIRANRFIRANRPDSRCESPGHLSTEQYVLTDVTHKQSVSCPLSDLQLLSHQAFLSKMLEYGCLSLRFQLPNLPLFTLKVILLLPCIGSLYITSMVNRLVQVHPLGIPSLEGKECLVLNKSASLTADAWLKVPHSSERKEAASNQRLAREG